MDGLAECYPAIRSYLRRHVPGQDVDDVTQIVFAEAWRSRHRFDPARPLTAWLLGIARHRAVDHLRLRTLRTVPLEAVPEPASPGEVVDAGVAERDQVRRALAELPEAQRQAIELAYYADLTQPEIAERLRVPLGTVKARTARGLHRLSALLPRAAA